MADLNELSAQEIGRRLRLARENAGIRQDQAAEVIGISRPTLVSIEKGIRRVRIQEIQLLARHYGTSVNGLLRREAVHTDLVPRFRKMRETEDDHTLEAIELLNDLVKAEVELENVLGVERRRNFPPEKGINHGDVVELAEKHAQELRDWLGLGAGPIGDVFSIIELDLGIRLYQRRLSSKSKVAGLFTYDDTVGACILLNANHRLERRVQSAAHELGHFVGTRRVPEVLEESEQFLSRDERYASAFGRAFLMPHKSFSESFKQLTAGADTLNRRHIILLAHQYNISREACVRRLEELELLKKGTWEWLKTKGGIRDYHAREVLGDAAERLDVAKTDANRLVSHRMSLMAHAAWKRGLMSEGQLAEMLKMRRVEVRDLIVLRHRSPDRASRRAKALKKRTFFTSSIRSIDLNPLQLFACCSCSSRNHLAPLVLPSTLILPASFRRFRSALICGLLLLGRTCSNSVMEAPFVPQFLMC